MAKALVLLANGSEEIETITVINLLRRAHIEVVVAGLQLLPVMGARKIQMTPEVNLHELETGSFDALIIPGGIQGVMNLSSDALVIELVKKMDQAGKLIGAICAAPLLLQTAELLKERKLTSHPSVKDDLNGCFYSEDKVVVDKNLITSRGPGTAVMFSLALIMTLVGEREARAVSEAIVA